MAVGTSLPSGCYLSVASPPSRDADTGLTMFGWFYVPSFSGYHTTLMLNYATNNVGEGFQFEGTSATQAGAFIMCYPSDYTSLGGTYASGTWYFQAEVFTRSGGVTTRRTYISSTAGAEPTLIATQTWAAPDASPERFDVGEAETFNRTLRGTLQYVGLAPVAMSLAQLATQSGSSTPTVSCWVFISAENGTLTDSSGNNRTITVTGGTPTASDVSAPVTAVDTMSAGATIGVTAGATASATGSLTAGATVGVDLSASTSPVAELSAGATIGLAQGSTTIAGNGSVTANATISESNSGGFSNTLPRIICYGNSVTSGYGVSDPSLHYPEQLKLLLGDRVESVVKLGYPGVATASLDSQFATNVGPYIEAGRRTIIIWQEVFNSAHSGVDAASIMASFWSVCAKAQAAGCEVIVQDTSAASLARQAHPEVVAACNATMESEWALHAHGFIKISTTFYNPTNTTLYQEDQAHFTATGLHTLAELSYTETDRVLIGDGFEADLGASATIGVTASTTVEGTGTLAGTATVGVEITSAFTFVAGQMDAGASIGLEASSTISGFGSITSDSTIGFTAEASTVPLSLMAADATIGTEVSTQAEGYGTLFGDAPMSVWSQSELGFEPGPLFAAFDVSMGLAGEIGGSAEIFGDLTIGLTASSSVYTGSSLPPFTGRAFTDTRSKQCGGRFVVQFAALTDSLGNAVDTEAHLHVFANGVQVAVLTRAGGEITYDAEARTYTAMYRQDTPALMRCAWHFPTIEHVGAPIDFPVRGPVLTEPASI